MKRKIVFDFENKKIIASKIEKNLLISKSDYQLNIQNMRKAHDLIEKYNLVEGTTNSFTVEEENEEK